MINKSIDDVKCGMVHGNLYELIEHDPTQEMVKESYESLIISLVRQKEALEIIGYNYRLLNNEYASSKDMFKAVNNNHCIDVLATEYTFENMPSDHPMLKIIDGIRVNDIFRFVHDLIGHYIPRNSFSANGEKQAWIAHMVSLPPLSWMALFCETRGQNAWTNFMKNHQDLTLSERPFPTQKAGMVDMKEVLQPLLKLDTVSKEQKFFIQTGLRELS